MAASTQVGEDQAEVAIKNNVTSSIECTDDRDDISFDPDIALMPEELVEVPTYKYTKICDSQLIEETRELVRKRFEQRNKDSFYESDYNLLFKDDWAVSRFLLRCRLNPERACNLIEHFASFRKEYKMGEAQYCHFPMELYKLMSEFIYQPDIAGNTTLWVKVKGHRRIPDLFDLVKKYMMCVAADCDIKSNGRGTTLVVDCTNAGFKTADPQLMYWAIQTFRDVFPKGLTYCLIVNMPRTLKAILQLAINWLSHTNKKKLRFVNNEEIFKFIPKENVPKYLGGTCQIEPNRDSYLNDTCEPARVIEDESHPVRLTETEVQLLQHYYKKRCQQT